MAEQIVSKTWGDGLLTTSNAAVATMVSEAGVALQMRLFSDHSADVTVTVSINTSGTLRPYVRVGLVAEGGSALVDLPDLADGDSVSALASVGGVVNYVVSGGSQTND